KKQFLQNVVEIEAFANISIDDESLRLLMITTEKKLAHTRFAVLNIPEEKTVFHLVFQPTLQSNGTPEEKKEMAAIFKVTEDEIPQAEPTLTGLVHQASGKIRKERAQRKRISRCDLRLISELKNENNLEKGTLYVNPRNGDYITRDPIIGKIQKGNLL